MDAPRRAAPEVVAAMKATAKAAAELLAAHGIAVLTLADRGDDPGAEIDVDTIADAAQGVYVSWYAGAEAVRAAIAAVQEERFDDPAVTALAGAQRQRISELAAILRAGGLDVETADDEYRPYAIRVRFPAPPGPKARPPLKELPHFDFDPPGTPLCTGGDGCASMRAWALLWADGTDLARRDTPVLGFARAWAGAADALERDGRFDVRDPQAGLRYTLERDGDRVALRAADREAGLTAAALAWLEERIVQGAFAYLYAHHPHLDADPGLLALRTELGIGPPRTAPVADDRLRALAAARMQPYPYATDWDAVHAALGLETPPDYRELVDRFGAGGFDDYLHVYGARDCLPAFDIVEQGLWWDAYFRETGGMDTLPEPFRGRDVTIVSWGDTEDGAHLFWLAEAGTAPERWPVALHTTEGRRWEVYEASALDVLTALARGELPTELIPLGDGLAVYHPLW